MKYAKVENGVVSLVMLNNSEGLIPCDDNVACGMLYDGSNFSLPIDSVQEAKLKKLKELSDLLYVKNSAPIVYNGMTFDGDFAAQQNLGAAMTYKLVSSPLDTDTRYWTLANNTRVTITWGDLQAVAEALFQRNDANYASASTHKSAINSKETPEAVQDYDITTGW